LDGLRAFEVAARRLSFTEAAEELLVTQGAVSQRIKALERELGVLLFDRLARGLALTEEGERLAHSIRAGLEQIDRALAQVVRAKAEGPLILSVLPSFATRWLVPRLYRFTRRCPEIHVQVLSELALADLRSSRVHAALRFGGGDYPGLSTTTIMGDAVVPVCSPGLLAAGEPVRAPADLARLPILRDSSTEGDGSGTDWASWLAFVGASGLRLPEGQRFDQADLVIGAAASGLGVALARISLIGADLAANRLVRLPFPAMPTPYSYHLVSTHVMGRNPKLVALREWLLAEAQTGDARASRY
jgi:LysR family glycine cleavage system transcriptional activator